MEHVVWSRRPALTTPTVIAAFSGWNDAGDAATLAVRHLISAWGAEPVALIDAEEYFDFQMTRPAVELVEGHARRIVWPSNQAFAASTPGGDVVLFLGTEPQLRWRTFTHQITGIAEETGAQLVVTLGALLAEVPHRRPVGLIGTATEQHLIDRYDLQHSRYEGPTGIVGVLHDTCAAFSLASLSLWAAVPAYASQFPSAKAAAALAEGACDVVGSPFPGGELVVAAEEYDSQIDRFVAQDSDLARYVEGLDADNDDEDDEDDDTTGLADEAAADPEASTEQMLADIERFLRDQGGS
jgi:predicted ATP-grasp superfamily ATP-dependent carboligase